MDSSSATTKGPSRSMTGLRQAVLDALPEALFLLNPTSGELRALNAAADRWEPGGYLNGNNWNVTELLPDFKLLSLVDSISGFILSRAVDPVTNTFREVMLHLYQLAGTERELNDLDPPLQPSAHEEDKQMVLGLRPIGRATSENAPCRRDAFDDAFHDHLTRLPNRRLFQRRLERVVERASRARHFFAVLFVDLDRFKSVNDQFGHVQGDKLLVTAAHRLVEAVRPQDMVARRDGDEFTILLDDLDQPEDAAGVAQRILEHLQEPLPIEGPENHRITIGASIGIAIATDNSLTAEELISKADVAMYQAKALGGGTFLAQDKQHVRHESSASRKTSRPR